MHVYIQPSEPINVEWTNECRITKYLPHQARKTFYNSYVLPHMDYCSTLWGNANSPERIYKLQRRAARITANCKCRAPSDPLLKQLNWLPRSVYIPFFLFRFQICERKTKKEFVFRSQIWKRKTKKEFVIRFSFTNLKKRRKNGIYTDLPPPECVKCRQSQY